MQGGVAAGAWSGDKKKGSGSGSGCGGSGSGSGSGCGGGGGGGGGRHSAVTAADLPHIQQMDPCVLLLTQRLLGRG